ncbi:DNA translocase FtsK 4TM domain-containing protein [Hominifimenecus sp. rT4P-3]|uniref:FtsK/SpoIIIE family DNA translocase n=1 Tax=Hominifimenecus sp. rT4P-3 TaxID=3242979 RepID=UPI003DA3C2CF
MAQAKRKPSSGSKKKTASSRKPAAKKSSRKRNSAKNQSSGIGKEIGILVAFAIAVILFLGNMGMAGSIGAGLKSVQFGLFGTVAWIFPIYFFWAVCFAASNGSDYPVAAFLKILVLGMTLVTLCGILELLGARSLGTSYGLKDYYEMGAEGMNGGVCGGIWYRLLVPTLGVLGAYVILVVLTIAGVVFVTGKSFIRPLHERGARVMSSAKEDMARMREEQALRAAKKQEARRLRTEQLREERMRVEQKVQGVDLEHITLAEPASDEVLEEAVSKQKDRKMEMPVPDPKIAEAPVLETPGSGLNLDTFTGTIHQPAPTFTEIEDEPNFDAPVGMESIHSRKDKRTLSELEALDAELRAAMEDGTDFSSPDLSGSLQGESSAWDREAAVSAWNSSVQEDVEDSESAVWGLPEAPEEPLSGSWEEEQGRADEDEDSMAAYDEFAAPEPSAVEETVIPVPKKSAGHGESIWRENSQNDGNSGVTFRDHDVKTEPVSIVAPPPPKVKREYVLPSVRLLKMGPKKSGMSEQELKETAVKLQQTLQSYGVGVTVTDISCGPTVTRYELKPEQGVKVSKILSLTNDIKLNLAAADIRIEAPIPGKAAVGIEVPNTENQTVYLKELLDSEEFRKFPSRIGFGVGRDIGGKVIVADLARMPHLLIAGATGSGKSVCINTIIMSILYKATPDEVKLIMIDPKVVELSVYNGIPHLLIPVVTDPKKAAGALNWAVAEMTDRYKRFADQNVRDIKGYNQKVEEADDDQMEKMPQIVVIVDELADLMMVAPGEVEEAICRLAQLARAAGIHLVLATQRPSVNVITGLIKANVPSRIAFAVSSGVDSRTIIDMVGAEKLLGKGDMLFHPSGYPHPVRIQGAFVSDSEVNDVVDFLKEQADPVAAVPQDLERHLAGAKDEGSVGAGDRDEYFERCGRFIIEKEKASIGNLQRAFKIGFNRAARIMDQLADAGVVGPEEGTKARQILMTMEEFDALLETFR